MTNKSFKHLLASTLATLSVCLAAAPLQAENPSAFAQEAMPSIISKVDLQSLKIILQSRQDVVLLDARSEQYDDGRRIPGAQHLRENCSAEEAAAVIPSKTALIITYCANTRCPASDRLAKRLFALGYTNILEYPEGIQGWCSAQNPVTNTR